jgi:hypothetical protein
MVTMLLHFSLFQQAKKYLKVKSTVKFMALILSQNVILFQLNDLNST